MKITIACAFVFQTPIENEPDFATLKFSAGPPYEVWMFPPYASMQFRRRVISVLN